MSNLIWLDLKKVITLHTWQIREHGGSHGIRDQGLLESALTRPQQLFHYENANIAQLAASYAYGIVKNHPFVDGNTRTGILAATIFLRMNDYLLSVPEEDLYTKTMQLAAGEIAEGELAKWFFDNVFAMG